MPPEPMVPARLDVHERLAVRSPSSVSLAFPVKKIGLPTVKLEPSGGALMAAVGGWLGSFTVTVIMSLPGSPPVSVTDAVMVCVPAVSVEVEKLPPEPMAASRLEVHERLAVREPSSVSLAFPAIKIGSPAV